NVTKADQVITWANPADIVYGTALSDTQLNATVTVATGSASTALAYYPTAATALNNATAHTLTVTAAATANYKEATKTVTINVAKAKLTIKADDKTMALHASVPQLTASYSGFVNGDTPASLITPVALSTSATSSSDVGAYDILVNGATNPNYDITPVKGTL